MTNRRHDNIPVYSYRGFEGTSSEIAKQFKVPYNAVATYTRRNLKMLGYPIKIVGTYKYLYTLLDIEKDTKEEMTMYEILSKLIVAYSTAYQSYKYGRTMLGNYKIIGCNRVIVREELM